jgi:hypothetical protein
MNAARMACNARFFGARSEADFGDNRSGSTRKAARVATACAHCGGASLSYDSNSDGDIDGALSLGMTSFFSFNPEWSRILDRTRSHRGDGQYNWNGFSCLYRGRCQFRSVPVGHLVCEGAFLSFGFCGAASYIEGFIASFDDRRQSFEPGVGPEQSEPMGRQESAATALPPARGKGPPARR